MLDMVAPTAAFAGWVVKASLLADDGLMVKETLLVVLPPPDAVSCLPEPAWLMLKLPNVATPNESAVCEVVPLSVPELSERDTETPGTATLRTSVAVTLTGGARI